MSEATESDGAFEILLVEDNARDVRLTQEALAESGFPCHLRVATDGEIALRMLRHEAPYADAPQPDLILLDINLPRVNGREVLAEIKRDAALCTTPVVILSTSHADADVATCYRLHANSYITKPLDFDHFVQLMRSVCDYWLRHATPPPHRPSKSPP
ncbi:MAG: response regulator [Gammaproteobacteria bacterium]|nr:response regulator [Gammaproteobacteria bacterium]